MYSQRAAEENGLKRPLMAPRRSSIAAGGSKRGNGGLGGNHHRASPSNAAVAELLKRRTRCWRYCEPFCYGCVALAAVVGVIVFASVLLTMFPMPLHQLQVWVSNRTAASAATSAATATALTADDRQLPLFDTAGGLFYGEEVPCTVMRSQPLWSAAFARLNSESPVRKVDVTGDGVLDVVFGFGLDDSFEYDEAMVPRCPTTTTTTTTTTVNDRGKFASPPQPEEDAFCEGGVLALDGRSGAELWRRWTAFNVFSLFCTVDLSGDERADCVAAGRGGVSVFCEFMIIRSIQ